jgi:GT2 family glycosyltransferase
LVSIILVTYDNLDYTKQCLESIFAKTAYPNYEVIVVDNGSKDGTWSYLLNLRENHANLKIILNDENLGFAKANNMGIKESKGKYIIFLNNDTIITRGLIKGIVRYLEDKEVGMVGPVTNSIFNEAKVEVTYSTPDGLEDFAEQYTLAHGGESFEIKTLALYCAGIRREVMDDVGMLDERYKVGMFEDDDYSLRLRHRGYKVLCARDLFVHHYGMASFSKLKNEEYLKIFIENKKRFEEKWAVNWEPHIHNAREEEEKVRDHNNFQKGIALTKVSIKKYVPDKIKRILRPYYKRYVVNDNAESTGKNEANYRVYQERLKIQFKKNRYEGFMKKFLQDKHYEDIIFYPSLVDWDIPLFQRPHQIFRELSRRGYLVFFLTPNPRGDHVNPIRRINDNLYLVKDIDMLYDLKEKPLILWISWTPNIVCEEFLQKSRVVYDYMDELEVFAYHCKLMEVDHKKLIQTSDIVITSASNLYLEVQETRRDVILMPNGVCVEDFRPGEDKVPKDLKPIIDKGRPIIGYYGALAKWLDYDLVNFACKQCKDLSFVFIGPELDGSFKRFRSSNNLFLLGAKRYEELKYYLKHFDVATIPFKIDKIAHSTSPVKLFEYMAGEKPIVTTEMKECKKYRSVLISKDRREYILNIRKALMLRYDSDYTSTLKREASVNTWSSRIDVIIKHLQKKN